MGVTVAPDEINQGRKNFRLQEDRVGRAHAVFRGQLDHVALPLGEDSVAQVYGLSHRSPHLRLASTAS